MSVRRFQAPPPVPANAHSTRNYGFQQVSVIEREPQPVFVSPWFVSAP